MPLSGSDRDYADQLAAIIVDHIGNEYTAEECGRALEIRPQPTKVDAVVSAHLRTPVASVGVIATACLVGSEGDVETDQAGGRVDSDGRGSPGGLGGTGRSAGQLGGGVL